MFRENRWYNYKNYTDCTIRYMLRHDIMADDIEVWAIICMYNADLINMFAFPTEEIAQKNMKMLTGLEV